MSFRHSTIILVIFLGLTISSGNIPSALGGIPPDIEVDTFPHTTAQIELEVLPDGSTFLVTLTGPSTVHVNLGNLGDPDFDLLEQVPIELVQLTLTGNSPLGPVNLGLNPAIRSLGEIEEDANTQQNRLDLPPFAPGGTAHSFFDVFFELNLPDLGLQLHNDQPARVQTIIDHKPPTPGTRYCGEVGVLLIDQTGAPRVRILNVCHIIDGGGNGDGSVGGELVPIETTSLLLTGAQSTTWLLPVVLSIVGIGMFVVSRKTENS